MELHNFLRLAAQLDPGSKSFTVVDSAAGRARSMTLPSSRPESQKVAMTAEGADVGAGSNVDCGAGIGTTFWVPSGSLSLLEEDLTRVAVLSSRLPQKLELCSGWFDALRTLGGQWVREQRQPETVILTADGTTADRFVRRLGDLFGVRVLTLELISSAVKEEALRQRLANRSDRVFVFQASGRKRFAADHWLAMLSHQCFVFSVRSGGNVFSAVECRLDAEALPLSFGLKGQGDGARLIQTSEILGELENPRVSTRLLVDRQLTNKKTEETLREAGAAAWWLAGDSKSTQDGEPVQPVDLPVRVLDYSEVATLPFLIHWTRRRVGPWPDQTEEEFLDDLIFRTPRSDHSPLGSLCRILAGQSILATNDLTRDPQPVVCFSDMDLSTFLNRRVFRPHLSRWDFEPYGIAFDREWLADHFAKPVIYGDESDWQSMPIHQRPFYQSKRSKDGKIDWTVEREWRGIGNLNLKDVPSDAALVFVQQAKELSVVSKFSRWPIVALDADEGNQG